MDESKQTGASSPPRSDPATPIRRQSPSNGRKRTATETPSESRRTLKVPRQTSSASTPSTTSSKRASSPLDEIANSPGVFGSPFGDSLFDVSHTSLLEDETDFLARMEEEMEEERRTSPYSDTWAKDEVKLFEVLFKREFSPLLPKHWSGDFTDTPIPRVLFNTSTDVPPTIYSLTASDFKATRALKKLINLTTDVRSLGQQGRHHRMSTYIRKGLEDYAKWAAQDGGYENLDIVPNLIIEDIDLRVASGGTEIERHMQTRMRSLAASHRDYWRVERVSEDQQWDLPVAPKEEGQDTAEGSDEDDAKVKVEEPKESSPQPEYRYTRQPPVLYGIFIINHTILALSLDSAKEDKDAHISCQVEVDFSARHQGVWNALTVAIIFCMARDNMFGLADDFVQLVDGGDDDPDA